MAEVPEEWFEGASYSVGEVASLFNVSTQTVTRWAKQGVIGYFRTPTGNRCYPETEVGRITRGEPAPPIVKELADEDNRQWHKKWQDGWRRNEVIGVNQPGAGKPKTARDADERGAT